MANSDYYSRVLIRSMKGWLLSLKLSEKLPKKNVNKIVEKIPDAKRLLQKLSLCIAKNSKDVEAIGTFVSAWEFLKYKQSFDEIIVTPTDRPNRVEGINIVCDKKKNSEKELVFTNIHSRYGHSKLSAFSTAASNRGIRNLYQGDDNWQKQIGKSSINIRQLIPIDSENVIVLADSCVGIANKYLKAIDWQIDIKDITLWSMTYYPDYNQDQDGLLAIGGEWHKNLDAIFTYRFDNKNHAHKKFHRVNNKLYLPSNWSSRTRFSQLQWDEKGNLWAVTGDRGELFCWENALAHIQDINSGSITAKHLASCGHTQHALVVTENHVLTGGDTGVLRAFNHSGQLLWANVYESSIRAITSTLLNSESDQKLCAAFATVTENGQLILCNENGIQQGYFRTSGHHHVNNMVSKIVGASKTQHHLIGMYSGETRLVEEVPQNWHPRDYLNVELYKPWEDITSSIQKVAENKKLCQQWCGLDDIEIAIKEPYRAIWAARQLIEKYRDYTNVIKLLKNERIKQRFDPVVKELQIGLLGLLGESLKELPDEFHKDIIELCRASRYYGFTKFILRVPKLDSNNNKQMELLGTLSNIAHKKILTGDVSVTAAILQRLRLQEKSGKPEDDLQYLLYRAIREIKVFERQVHIGYIESLFALLFKQADLDKKGILGVFFQIEHKYPRLIKLFKKRKETVNKFVTWLNLYSQTLFNEPDFLLWVNLAPELLKHQVNKQVIKNILKDPKIGREADRKLLQSYLNLFPNSNICGTHLDKDWSQYLELVKALRTGSSQINNHTISSEDAAQWFETHENLLNKDKIQPLLRSFEKLLFNEWLSELTQLRHVLVLPKPYSLIHEQSTISLSNEFKEVFQRFFQVMYEIGYEQDGIFCQAHHVLGCSGYLEPVVSLRGHQHSKQVKTHQESLLAELKIFATDEKLPNDADLVYKQCEKKPFLIIPLLGINPLWNESNNYLFNQADIPRDKYLATFVFIFSSTKDILEEQPDSRKTLLTILRQINQYITIERTKNQNKQYEILSRLEHHYFHNNHYDEQGLFLAAKDLTSASGGLLAMENTATNWLDVRISRGTENTYLTHTQFDTRDNQNPVTRCWSDSKLLSIPKLAQNNLYKKFYQLIDIDEDNLEPNTTNIKKWLDKSVDGSMLIAPIFKGSTNNKLVKVGILLLSSHKPKFFTTEKVAIVEQLLQKIHWVLETIKLREQQEYMQGLFLHEIRSVVIPIAQNVDFMSKSPQDKMPEQLMNVKRYADKAKDLVENYLSITGSFVDKNSTFKDTYRTISRFLDLNKTRIELSQQKVTIKTPNHKLWHDAHLVGIKSVYERVVRVLLDNALKYGGNHADINITVNKVGKMWQLTITNPGYMTKEENQLKFEAFKFSLDREPNKAPTGTHLGLAASKRVVEAYDGQLLVENYSEYGEKRVIATLLWPLALESEQGEHHE
ncbi:HAMP domain-containing sensor histidine kinase [Candidatus Albibeggiatoa sp. nov. BB20]|uniref:sensor histidine kinase n=1 Tax=Candidatus Albibeggiatoa sp. nov. BB20 TaxID=3162723 RepID=UPI003365A9BA